MKTRKPDAAEEKRKALCLEQLAVDRQALLIRWPFIGSIIMRMELVPVRDDRLETAATDGSAIFADVDFYGSLSREERLFVLAHEVWHSALLHFARRGARDTRLFNMAADLEIHFALRQEKMREPWVLPHSKSWEKLSAEEIYEQLLQEDSRRQDSGNGGASPKTGKKAKPEKDDCFDRHIYEGDEIGEGGEGMAEEEGEFVIDDDYTPSVRADAAERIRSRVIAAAQQLERTRGKLPDAATILLNRLLDPEIPWQEVLKQFVTSCFGGKRRWLPPSRRHVWNDLYLPSLRGEALKAVVAIDTSGSTLGVLDRFFSELVSLMRSFGRYELVVIQCDAEVTKTETFTDSAPLPPGWIPEVRGGGGTDFRPVFEHVKKLEVRPEVLVYITDGLGPAPEQPPPYPVLWVLTAGGKRPAQWGQSVFFK